MHVNDLEAVKHACHLVEYGAVAMFLMGMYFVPLSVMHLDLSRIPGDLVDARLNNYFLEHGYKWLTGQVASFWSAPFFFPAPR